MAESDFSGKFVFWVFGAKRVQKEPKIGSLSFFLKIASLLFSDFGPELGKFGSYKIASVRLSVSPSVSQSVRNALFSELAY